MNRESHLAVSFARQIGTLLNLAIEKNTRDRQLKELRERYTIIQTENPIKVIEMAGPCVWRYREQIKAGDVKHFMSADLISENCTDLDEDEINYASQLITSLRMLWQLFTEPERQVVINGFKRLVSLYAEYLASLRQL